MTELTDTMNWGIGTAMTIGVAGMAMKGMGNLTKLGSPSIKRRIRRRRRR